MAKAKALDKRSSKNKVNVTVKIDKDLLRKIRIIAAEEGTSISGLVTEIFEERSTKSERYEQARKCALALMNSGVPLNWEKPLSRDEVHERQ
jgi:predicted DNA-binding ribbon-helix-helix protein